MMKLEGDDMVESKTEALKNIARVGRAMSVYMPNSLDNDLTVLTIIFYSHKTRLMPLQFQIILLNLSNFLVNR